MAMPFQHHAGNEMRGLMIALPFALKATGTAPAEKMPLPLQDAQQVGENMAMPLRAAERVCLQKASAKTMRLASASAALEGKISLASALPCLASAKSAKKSIKVPKPLRKATKPKSASRKVAKERPNSTFSVAECSVNQLTKLFRNHSLPDKVKGNTRAFCACNCSLAQFWIRRCLKCRWHALAQATSRNNCKTLQQP